VTEYRETEQRHTPQMTEHGSTEHGTDFAPAALWDHPRGLGRELWRRHDLSNAARATRGGPTARMLSRLRLARGPRLAGLLQHRGHAPRRFPAFSDMPLFGFHFPHRPFDPGPTSAPVPGGSGSLVGPGHSAPGGARPPRRGTSAAQALRRSPAVYDMPLRGFHFPHRPFDPAPTSAPVPGASGSLGPGHSAPGGARPPHRGTSAAQTLRRAPIVIGRAPMAHAVVRRYAESPRESGASPALQVLRRSVARRAGTPRDRMTRGTGTLPATSAGASPTPVPAREIQLWRPLPPAPATPQAALVVSGKDPFRPSPPPPAQVVPSRGAPVRLTVVAARQRLTGSEGALYRKARQRSQGIPRTIPPLPASGFPSVRIALPAQALFVTSQSPSSNPLSRNGRGLGRGVKKGGGTERLPLFPIAPAPHRASLSPEPSAGANPDSGATVAVGARRTIGGTPGGHPLAATRGPASTIRSAAALSMLWSTPFAPSRGATGAAPGQPRDSAATAKPTATAQALSRGPARRLTNLLGLAAERLQPTGGYLPETTENRAENDRPTGQPLPEVPDFSASGAEAGRARPFAAAPAAQRTLSRGTIPLAPSDPIARVLNRTAAVHGPLRRSTELRAPPGRGPASHAAQTGQVPAVGSLPAPVVASWSMIPVQRRHWSAGKQRPVAVSRSAEHSSGVVAVPERRSGGGVAQNPHRHPIPGQPPVLTLRAASGAAAAGAMGRRPGGNGNDRHPTAAAPSGLRHTSVIGAYRDSAAAAGPIPFRSPRSATGRRTGTDATAGGDSAPATGSLAAGILRRLTDQGTRRATKGDLLPGGTLPGSLLPQHPRTPHIRTDIGHNRLAATAFAPPVRDATATAVQRDIAIAWLPGGSAVSLLPTATFTRRQATAAVNRLRRVSLPPSETGTSRIGPAPPLLRGPAGPGAARRGGQRIPAAPSSGHPVPGAAARGPLGPLQRVGVGYAARVARIGRAAHSLHPQAPFLALPATEGYIRAREGIARGNAATVALSTSPLAEAPVQAAAAAASATVLRFTTGAEMVTVQSPSSDPLSRNGRGLGRGVKEGGGTERLPEMSPPLRRGSVPAALPGRPGEYAVGIQTAPEARLPLVVPALSPRPGRRESAASLQSQRAAPASTRLEDLEAVPEQVPQEPDQGPGGAGLDVLADKVWRKLMRRLTIERERRGALPWS
jgi:hypothetical protein